MGLGFGFVVLHPVTMIIFRWLDPRLAPAMGAGQIPSFLDPIFVPSSGDGGHGPVFGFFCAALAMVDGYYRNRLGRELEVSEAYRLELARQAGLLRAKNEKLVRLEETNRRHTKFMVDDFKTHLASILGFAELLLGKESPGSDPTRVEALTRIRRQALRMAGAVKDLLDFADFGSHRCCISGEPRFPPCSSSSLKTFRFRRTWDRWRTPPAAESARTWPSTSLIERVLVNLAFNAIRHNRPGARVVLGARPDLEPRGVAFTCTDDGRGLSRAALATLFKEVGTKGDTDHDEDDSTGFGLAFCKAAVEAHGGRIWCESSEGQGARFTFTVPLEPKELPMSKQKAPRPGRR